jgi:hypothetical protein
MNAKTNILYCRLSRDDGENDRESNSIQNQKRILTEYAERNGFTPYIIAAEACDIIEPNPRSLATSGFQGIWFILYYA